MDYDEKHVDLKWLKPRKENGAPVTKYIVEGRKHPSGEWVKMKDTPDTKTSVPWNEGDTYEFRVFAVNKAGVSQPCNATAPLLAKPRLCKRLTLILLLSSFCNRFDTLYAFIYDNSTPLLLIHM